MTVELIHRSSRWDQHSNATESVKPRYVIAIDVVALALAAPTLLFPGAWTVGGIALLAVPWAVRWLATGRPSVATPLDLPIGLLLVAAAIGFVASPVRAGSASEVGGLLLGVAVYYVLCNSLAQRVSGRVALWIAVLVGLACGLAMLPRIDWTLAPITALGPLDLVYRRLSAVERAISGPLPNVGVPFNPRELGGIMALALPAIVGLCCDGKAHPLSRLALAIAGCAIAVLAVLSQSVSAIVGLAGAVWLIVVLTDARRRTAWLVGSAAALAIGGAAAWWRLSGPVGVVERVAAASQPRPGIAHAAFGVESRFEIWERALRMIHDMPYTGIGPGLFRVVMDRFYPGFVLGPQPHAHNLWLQAGVELGLPGAVGFTWLLAAFALGVASAYRRADDPRTRLAALGLGAGVLAFCMFGAIDVIRLGESPALALWVVLALGASLGGRPKLAWRRTLHWSMGAALVVVLAVPLLWAGPSLNLGRTFALRGLLAGGGQGDLADLSRAGANLSAAAAKDPNDPGTWYLLAETQSALGDQQGAVDSLQRGVLADSQAPMLRYSALRGLAQPEGRRDWGGLRRVYSQWTTRYPDLAQWYVADAMAACVGSGDFAAAQRSLAEGLQARAQPAQLLGVYRADMQHCP